MLAVLENTEYTADRNKAKATLDLSKQRLLELEHGNRADEIKQVEAELEEAKSQLVNLEGEWKRSQELRQKKFTSEAEFETAKSQFLSMTSKVIRLSAALSLMREGPRQERIEAARTKSDRPRAIWPPNGD